MCNNQNNEDKELEDKSNLLKDKLLTNSVICFLIIIYEFFFKIYRIYLHNFNPVKFCKNVFTSNKTSPINERYIERKAVNPY